MEQDLSNELMQQLQTIGKRIDDGYQVLQCMKQMLSERAAAEEVHGNKLQALSSKWEKVISKRGEYSQMKEAAMVLVMEAWKGADIHLKMAREIESDCIKSLEKLTDSFYTAENEDILEVTPSNRNLLQVSYEMPWVQQASLLERHTKSLNSFQKNSDNRSVLFHKAKLNYLSALEGLQEQEKVWREKTQHLALECAKVEERGKIRFKEILKTVFDHLDYTNEKCVEGTYDHLRWLVNLPYSKETDATKQLSSSVDIGLNSQSVTVVDNIVTLSKNNTATLDVDSKEVSSGEEQNEHLLFNGLGDVDENKKSNAEKKVGKKRKRRKRSKKSLKGNLAEDGMKGYLDTNWLSES